MTRIETSFGFESTAAEVADGIDLTGRRAIVTGAASGIGVETARALAGRGAEVTLAVRNVEAGEAAAAEIISTTGNDAIAVAPLELADRASIQAFVDAWEGPLHLLVNNAGVMAIQERTLSPEGLELQFATNHLGHFALATGLHGALAEAGAEYMARRRAELGGSVSFKSVEQGAATSVLVATSPQLEGVGGRYFEDCNEAEVVRERPAGSGLNGVAPYALDPANAERLWEVSEALLRP